MRKTPFDKHAARAEAEGYHNHRVNTHSDLISEGIMEDLYAACPALRIDLDMGTVGFWANRRNPWGRKRNTDLIVAKPLAAPARRIDRTPSEAPRWALGVKGAAALGLAPDPSQVRIVGEHKSIVTAHRNRSARHDDLDHLYQDANAKSPGTIVCATIMIGTAPWYLNVADGVKGFYDVWDRDANGIRRRKIFREADFDREVMPRLRRHDETLMDDYISAVSENTERDVEASFELFRDEIPVRPRGDRTKPGFDAFLVVPVHYDNIHPPHVSRDSAIARRFGIDVDAQYGEFIDRLAEAYTTTFSPAGPPPIPFAQIV